MSETLKFELPSHIALHVIDPSPTIAQQETGTEQPPYLGSGHLNNVDNGLILISGVTTGLVLGAAVMTAINRMMHPRQRS